MRIFTAIMVALAVLATAVASVRLHLHVAKMRYRVSGLEADRVRAERELRLAQAELEAAKAPRTLMERWSETHGATYGSSVALVRSGGPSATPTTAPAPSPAMAETAPVDPGSDERDVSTDDVNDADGKAPR